MDAWLKYRQVWGARGTDLCPAGRKRPAREEGGGGTPLRSCGTPQKGEERAGAALPAGRIHCMESWVGLEGPQGRGRRVGSSKKTIAGSRNGF